VGDGWGRVMCWRCTDGSAFWYIYHLVKKGVGDRGRGRSSVLIT